MVLIMAWSHQVTSHYWSQCWPKSMLPHGITWQLWIKKNSITIEIWRIYDFALIKILILLQYDFSMTFNCDQNCQWNRPLTCKVCVHHTINYYLYLRKSIQSLHVYPFEKQYKHAAVSDIILTFCNTDICISCPSSWKAQIYISCSDRKG